MPLFNTFLWLTFPFTICAALPSSCKHSKVVNSREVRASRNGVALHGEPMWNTEGWQCWEWMTFLSVSVHTKMIPYTRDCAVGRSLVGNGHNNVTFCPVIKWKCPRGKFLARTVMCWASPWLPFDFLSEQSDLGCGYLRAVLCKSCDFSCMPQTLQNHNLQIHIVMLWKIQRKHQQELGWAFSALLLVMKYVTIFWWLFSSQL